MRLHFATALLFSATLAAPAHPAESYRPARMEDGRVDMQGVWNLSNLTPLERMSGFDSLVISREQATAIEERILGMRRGQATGAAAEVFDEQRFVEPMVPGTSSIALLRENLAAANLRLPDDALKALNAIGR